MYTQKKHKHRYKRKQNISINMIHNVWEKIWINKPFWNSNSNGHIFLVRIKLFRLMP